MSCYIHIFDKTPVQLWGLSSSQRIRRELEWELSSLKGKDSALVSAGTIEFVDDLQQVPADGEVVLFRGDYLYDVRIITNLIGAANTLLQVSEDGAGVTVAAHTGAATAARVLEHIRGNDRELPGKFNIKTPESLVPQTQIRLKKAHAAFVLPITKENSRDLERHLFKTAYKGITDLVTKWVWPAPARWVTRLCVRLGLRPNHVTALSWVLAIQAGLLFYQGEFVAGLLTGWLMTFLDTVDGKLARVTVTSSKFGHYFDHIIDLVHPPLWYIMWGLGLSNGQIDSLGFPMNTLFYLILIGYIAGRLVEGSFQLFLGRFGIFCWQPLDAYFRLITARRNPNMLFLTLSYLIGRPDLGLLAVVFWTVTTSIFLLIRLGTAGYVRSSQGPLKSWLSDADQPMYDKSLAVRLFTKHITS
jgi:phosphatidylglycerophosphate synthase